MRLGVIDIGSNTVHLLVVDAVRDARPGPAADERTTVRLMRYLDDEGRINDDGVAALRAAVADAARAAERLQVEDSIGLATSAIRAAPNGADVLDQLEKIAGVPLQVLTGEQEAELTFLAARRWHGWAAGRLLVIDIGGGSLEIALGIDERPEFTASLPLGAGRLTRLFLPTDPPTDKEMAALKSHVKEALRPIAEELRRFGRPDHVVGTSKTIRSLARLAGQRVAVVGPEERRRMQLADLKDWTPRLANIPAQQRMELPGITAERTHQVVGGAVVVQRAMKALAVDELELCPWALREGVILRRLDQIAE